MKILKTINIFALVFFLSIGGYISSATATDVCGGIFDDTTWTLAESPYNVTCDVTLFQEYTLTIEPGVIINFDPSTNLSIKGTFNAIGTEDKRITFTSVSPPDNWSGVYLATNLGGKAVIEYADFSYASTAIFVECCWGVDKPADISNSTFRNNGTALGGYAGNNVVIDNSTFEDNTYAITQADKEIYSSVFTNNDYGLYQTERISVYSSTFTDHIVALWGGRGEVRYCDISNNTTGIQAFFEGFDLSRNTIINNEVGVILGQYDGYTPPVEYNNIHDNITYNMKNTGSANNYVPNNWWGTTDTAEIDAKLYDGKDDPSLGLLEYIPFLTEPVPEVAANLSVTKSASPDPVMVGENLTYTIVVANDGPDEATEVTLTDNLPDNVEFVSATPTQGSCSGTSIITCELGTLSEGTDATVMIVVTPTVGEEITNKANIVGTEPDPNPDNNMATETTTVKSGGPGGSVTGISTKKIKVMCFNMTTKQKVNFKLPQGSTSWSCEEEGLIVNPGDKIKMTVKVNGTAD